MKRVFVFPAVLVCLAIIAFIGTNEGKAERAIARELSLTKVERNLMQDCKRGLMRTEARFSEGATPTSGCACMAKAINQHAGKSRIFARDTMMSLFAMSRKNDDREIEQIQNNLYAKSIRLDMRDSDIVQIIGTTRRNIEACGKVRPVVKFRPKLKLES